MAKYWSAAEVWFLQQNWGEKNATEIAHYLGRTHQAVSEKARKLELGPVNRGRYSVFTLEKEFGYDRERIQKSCKRLKIKLRVGLVGTKCTRTSKRVRRRFIPEDRLEELLAYLAKYPDGKRIFDPGGIRTGADEWGTGLKPPACLGCKRTDRKHEAFGYCAACRARARRAKAKGREPVYAAPSP